MERYKIPDKKKNTMTNMEINIGLEVTKKTHTLTGCVTY